MIRINAFLFVLIILGSTCTNKGYGFIDLPPSLFCYDDQVLNQNVDASTFSVEDTIDGSKHIEINGTIANDIWLFEHTMMTFHSGNARVRTRGSSILRAPLKISV